MATLSRPDDLSLRNPVTQAELTHIRRGASAGRILYRRLFRGLYTFSLLASGGLFVWMLVLAYTNPPGFYSPGQAVLRRLDTAVIALVVWATFLHFATLIRTLSLASETMMREKRAGTWETLVLTNVHASRLVLGKWLAVIHTTWRDFLWLGLLRAGVSVGLGTVVFSRRYFAVAFAGMPSPDPARDILLAGLIILPLTLINGLFTAAAGVVGSLLGRETTPGVVTAMAVRMVAALAPVTVFLLFELWIIFNTSMFTAQQAEQIARFGEPLMFAQLTLIDNGTTPAAMLANPNSSGGGVILAGVVVALVLYGLLTLGLLRLGAFIARRQGATEG